MTNAALPAPPTLLQRTLWFQMWENLASRWRFKFTLPRIQTVALEGVRLDVASLSGVMKNNLLLGRYEVQERLMVQRFLTRDDAVLELGGAIGFIGLYCQTRLGISRYATVEANPATVELLQRNYALNDRRPVVWNLALAGADAEVALEVGGEFWENSTVGGITTGRTVRVPGTTLAGVLRRLDFAPTALIVDIEGAEQFLDPRQIPASVTKLIIELHPRIIGTERVFRLIADLVNAGFRGVHEESGTAVFLRP